MKSKSGFTIVELLITIVVVAILAVISVVAFNGIQERALNAQIISGVRSYHQAILNYITVNGQYPPGGPGCVGAGYTDTGSCWTYNGTPQMGFANSSFDTAIAPFLGPGSKPTTGNKKLQFAGGHYRTGFYYGGANNEYYLIGKNQTCPIGTRGSAPAETTQCIIKYTLN